MARAQGHFPLRKSPELRNFSSFYFCYKRGQLRALCVVEDVKSNSCQGKASVESHHPCGNIRKLLVENVDSQRLKNTFTNLISAY